MTTTSQQLKEKGNAALKEGDIAGAVGFYTQGIEGDPGNVVLYSNRSSAYVQWKKYQEALTDANKCIEIDSTWSKGYSRKGVALECLLKYRQAAEAYKKAVELDPSNELMKESLSSVLLKCAQNSMNGDSSKPEMTENQIAAITEKELGNIAYKAKNFEEAHGHYDKAIELDSTNIAYLTNKSAVFFEEGRYPDCIECCLKAVDVGRDNRADYKMIAKAFGRIGSCYEKQSDSQQAKKYYEKSLSEFRSPIVVKKVHELEKQIKESERLAYLNPEIAEEEKKLGNAAFTHGKFPEALKHYTEAIRRNPEDAKIYSNRAACYSKLMEFQLALGDCEKCIELAPEFIKGYLRKGACKVALKDFNGAKGAFRKALEIDRNCDEARDGLRQCVTTDVDPETARKNAMNDPEVTAILADPAMRMILNQMEDPQAVREHLNNPEIRTKLMKLIDAGLISVR